jgi:hypothetical protein
LQLNRNPRATAVGNWVDHILRKKTLRLKWWECGGMLWVWMFHFKSVVQPRHEHSQALLHKVRSGDYLSETMKSVQIVSVRCTWCILTLHILIVLFVFWLNCVRFSCLGHLRLSLRVFVKIHVF